MTTPLNCITLAHHWLILHQLWKQRQVPFPWVLVVTLLLIALGLLGTFPPFAKVFGGG